VVISHETPAHDDLLDPIAEAIIVFFVAAMMRSSTERSSGSTPDYDETAFDLAAKRGPTDVTRLLGHGVQEQATAAALLQPIRGERRNSIPGAVECALAMTEKQVSTSSASTDATRVTRRICRRRPPPSRVAAG
jgi:hypothetical protein